MISSGWAALKLEVFFWRGLSTIVASCCGWRIWDLGLKGRRAQVERDEGNGRTKNQEPKGGRNIFKKFGGNNLEVVWRLGVVEMGGRNIRAYIPRFRVRSSRFKVGNGCLGSRGLPDCQRADAPKWQAFFYVALQINLIHTGAAVRIHP